MEQKPKLPVGGNIEGFISIRPRPRQVHQYKPIESQPIIADALLKNNTSKASDSTEITDNFQPIPVTNNAQPTSSKPIRPKIRHRQGWSLRKKIALSFFGVMLVGFAFGSYYGSTLISTLDKTFHGNVFSDVHALFSNVELKGQAQGRVNILLAGDSVGDPGHQGPQLSDSIMVLSINTNNHTAFMLSIPRDLWVYVPGFSSYQKINAANDISTQELQQIVESDLGIPIDYYATINYQAFKDAVDAVGGITIDIQSPDPRGLYDAYTHLKLPNGWDTLNGEEALNLARARGDNSAGDVSYGFPYTDFTRTQHQRQMALAIAKKATSLGVLANPIRITDLLKAIGNNVGTNMNLQDVLAFARILKQVNFSKVGSYTYSSTMTGTPLSQALLTDYTDPASGEEALAPTAGVGNYGQLQEYYQQLTSNNPIVKEAASVMVLNGTNVNGLALRSEKILKDNKIDNVTIGNASSIYSSNMIINLSNNQDPATEQLLQKLFPGKVVNSTNGSAEAQVASGYNTDFVVVLGQTSSNLQQP